MAQTTACPYAECSTTPSLAGRGPLFGFHRWRANLRVREIEEIKSVLYTPIPHPFVERLIGTIPREYLDRVFFIARLTPAQRAGALRPAPAALDQYAGSGTAGACSNSRSPPDYDFATNG